MADDFITMQTRIARELNRSNMSEDIQAAINDAIVEGAGTRFYFNEMRGQSFETVIGQEYYDDLGITEVDTMWWLNGTSRWNLNTDNNIDMNNYALGTVPNGPPTEFSRYGQQFRLYPIPNTVFQMNVEGYGKLMPWPLVGDSDTNAWMTEGERYIRAVAKRIILTDRIRDFGEAKVQDAIADDQLAQLVNKTSLRIGTGILQPTTF